MNSWLRQCVFCSSLFLILFGQFIETHGFSEEIAQPASLLFLHPTPILPLELSKHDFLLKVGENASALVTPSISYNATFENETTVSLIFIASTSGIIQELPSIIVKSDRGDEFRNATVSIHAMAPGRVTIKSFLEGDSQNISSTNIFFRISVYQYAVLIIVSEVVGWIYFVAWSVSFYPQIYQNWRRKSVRGLSLDFVFMNWTGFFVYTMFNIGLFYVPSVQDEYLSRNPTGQIPVQSNDVFFSIHALFATSVTCLQCIFYDKGAQTISKTGKTILMSIFAVIFVLFIITVSSAIVWLDFLTACSTIKLLITLIKYVPQAYMNYARKSTSGWCIGNILLDLTGGILSVVQMLILAFNNNDWSSLFGDYTKFGLGAFSILFDIFFIIQHYVLYNPK
ncbi:unnamed protein product [Allacma fusca]|uniref:Cystinosin n=1 Tax=Allacma fusca TaxID=39272 RepID=A0A8J2PXV8_9HEXA|nr:unnamed protein product [Allacma fusca]